MPGIPAPITSPPDPAELGRRLDRVRELMALDELDYCVSFDPVNVYYLTNFANFVHERPFILIVARKGTPKMLVPLLELSHVTSRARCRLDYVTYAEFPAPEGQNWFDVYPTLFAPGARVGVEAALPVGIAQRTPGTVVVGDLIDEVRIIKTDYEIGRIVHACSVVDLGHEKLLEICRPGLLEGEIYRSVNGVMSEKIFADIPEANFIVTRTMSGVWPPAISHDPHLIPTLSLPMEVGGPHVSIVVAQVDGYGVELERTFFLDQIPNHARRPFNAMFAARAKAFEMLQPGQDLAGIDAAVRKVITEAGYEDGIIHRTGHGFGITGHEAPYLAIGERRALEPGMVVSIEPGIYRKGEGGYRHSDTVLITEEGYVNLTHAPETLEELLLPA